MRTVLLFAGVFILILCSCNKAETPESTLEEFVNLRFSGEPGRAKLLSYLSGPLYNKIAEMRDEDFEKFVDSSKIKKNRFEINLKKCDAAKCHITYTVKYVMEESKAVSHRVEVKKIAELRKIGTDWKIDIINNVKSYIDADGINLPVNK